MNARAVSVGDAGLVWSGRLTSYMSYDGVMRTVTVSEAKASLSELLERALAGEDIAIGRRGRAEVRLVVIDPESGPRELGMIDVSDYWMSEDFDAPLDDIADDFDPR
ncbi:MAG: type II toxin-antitoxin system prevent-host-death family antitoxin [Microthrixaceae bacterium]